MGTDYYYDDDEINHDFLEAEKWFKKDALLGNEHAQYMLDDK